MILEKFLPLKEGNYTPKISLKESALNLSKYISLEQVRYKGKLFKIRIKKSKSKIKI